MTIAVVGAVGWAVTGTAAQRAIEEADVLVGGARLLSAVTPTGSEAEQIVLGNVAEALERVAMRVDEGRQICVVASGDPGFFGIVRALGERFGPQALDVHPSPSSVSLAFARLGLPWDDAAVVSAHGRTFADAVRAASTCPKVAVLTAPDNTPAELGAALIKLGATHQHAAVAAHLGGRDESVCVTDLAGLAAGTWDPLAVVVLWSGLGIAREASLGWGLPSSAYRHRDGMITKPPVRSVVLGLLGLPGPRPGAPPVLWDVGAGSGSVAIECARLAPWMEVVAVEADSASAADCAVNSRSHGVAIRVVEGVAPECFQPLPDPDRVFVGGGGLDVLEAAHRRLRPGGVTVATHAAIDRAAAAASLLGNLIEVTANQGEELPGGGWRLLAANPVFVTWGTR